MSRAAGGIALLAQPARRHPTRAHNRLAARLSGRLSLGLPGHMAEPRRCSGPARTCTMRVSTTCLGMGGTRWSVVVHALPEDAAAAAVDLLDSGIPARDVVDGLRAASHAARAGAWC